MGRETQGDTNGKTDRGERMRDRQQERHTAIERDRQRETVRKRQSGRDIERKRQTGSETARETGKDKQ